MDGAQVGVLEETHQVRLGSFLKGKHRMALETKISLKFLAILPNKPLEWKLPYEQLSALLVLADFTASNSSRAVTVRLLHSSSCGSRLTSSLSRPQTIASWEPFLQLTCEQFA
ncbi:Os04g0450825 [Oryza sativa Japonica Group]|uniref:Os04g0450825 protein n=1 Tax=Oryza sativa subsp. japonica TaxID=39947 RepID=A0A0P0WAU7_ORYSJ|nr:Os04g0450825 [Oryza sativa Japonica Group]